MKYFYLVVIFSFFASCSEKQEVRAKVFERKMLDQKRLLIRYRYVVREQTYTDSATIANMVINTDSITVIIDPSNPGKSLPDLSISTGNFKAEKKIKKTF